MWTKKYPSIYPPGSNYQGNNKEVVHLFHYLRQDFLPPLERWATQWLVGGWGLELGMTGNKDWPGLQWHVAVQHPAVLKLDRLRRGGQVIGRGSRGMDLTPPVGQRVPVEGVGGGVVMRQSVVVRRRQRGPQGGLAVVIWRTWRKEEGEMAISSCGLQPVTLHTYRGESRSNTSIDSSWESQSIETDQTA